MKKIPIKVHNISYNSRMFFDTYIINKDCENETPIIIKLPENKISKYSKTIIEDNNEFVNGFKIVQTRNGEYAYIREIDNFLLPYRYDIATNFNEYGFAMVAKKQNVSWIDTNFKYLNIEGKFIKEDLNTYSSFNGWQEVSEFSKGKIPLSRVYDGRNSVSKTAYLNTTGHLKRFYRYDGKLNKYSNSEFIGGTEFDENGFAMANNNLLFAKGYYCKYEDLIKICKKDGFLSSIQENAEKQYDENFSKILKK